MARIAGVDVPREKRVEVALTYIFGIGLPTSQKILAQTNINPDTRVRDLTDEGGLVDRTGSILCHQVRAPAGTGLPRALLTCR